MAEKITEKIKLYQEARREVVKHLEGTRKRAFEQKCNNAVYAQLIGKSKEGNSKIKSGSGLFVLVIGVLAIMAFALLSPNYISSITGLSFVTEGYGTDSNNASYDNTTDYEQLGYEQSSYGQSGYELLADANATQCGDIGKSITLLSNLTVNGTCFQVNTSSITINCQGYSIKGNSSGYGVNISATGIANITVTDCIFDNFSIGLYAASSGNHTFKYNVIYTYGSSGYGINTADNGNIIYGNNITTTGSTGYGIYTIGGLNTNYSNNNILTSGTSGYGIVLQQGASGNKILSNTVTAKGSSGYGVYLLNAVNHIIVKDNFINTTSSNSYGIYVSTSTTTRNETIVNNNITTSGNTGIGILLGAGVLDTNITKNRITTTNTNGNGIQVQVNRVGNNLLEYNTIVTSGSTAYGVRLLTASQDNNLTSNVIHTSGSGSRGISIESSYYNFVIDSFINATNAYEIFLQTAASNNSLINTTFNKSSIGFNTATDSSVIAVKYYVTANVSDTNGAAISSANVSGYNSSVISENYGLTGSNGIVRLVLAEFWQNASTIAYSTPHTINASKAGYSVNSTLINLTQTNSTSVALSLQLMDCGTVTGNLLLGQSFLANGTCLTIGAHNIDINCNGYALIGNSTGYGINISNYENITIRNCLINNFSAGIAVNGTGRHILRNNQINSSSGTSNSYGILINNSALNNLTDNKILTAGSGSYALYLSNSHSNEVINLQLNATNANDIFLSAAYSNNSFINITFNKSDVGFASATDTSSINPRYYVVLSVTDSAHGNVIINGNLTAYNTSNILEQQGLTDSSGKITLTLQESLQNATRTLYSTNHTIYANITGYLGNFTSVNLTISGATSSALINLAIEPIIKCSNISTSTTLLTDITTLRGSCFTINGSNMVLNCAGFTITGNSSGTGIAIQSVDNITVKNCRVTNFTTGISASNNGNHTIKDNVINSTVASGFGILLTTSINNYLFNNTVKITGANGPGIYLSSGANNNTIQQNTINATGSTGYGIYLQTSNSQNLILLNNIITHGSTGYAVYLTGSNHNRILNNIINTTGSNAYAIRVSSSSRNATIVNNNVTTTNSGAVPISLDFTTSENNVSNNILKSSGSDSYGIRIYSSATSNFIENNNITTSASGAYGIWLSTSSTGNNLTNNKITTTGSSGSGLYIDTSADNNYIASNLISTNSTAAYGIYLQSSYNNLFLNNRLNIPNANDIFLKTAGSNNTLLNLSFNKNDINFTAANDTSIIPLKWYVDVNITAAGNSNAPIYLANVSAYNTSSNNALPAVESFALTNTNGTVTLILTEFWQNATTKIYTTPHTINVTRGGYYPNTTTVNLTATNSTAARMTMNQILCGVLSADTLLGLNLNSNGTCFTINASHITLDCAGYKLIGNASGGGGGSGTNSGYAVNISDKNNVTIKNCEFVNFSNGVYSNGNNALNTLINVTHNRTLNYNTLSNNAQLAVKWYADITLTDAGDLSAIANENITAYNSSAQQEQFLVTTSAGKAFLTLQEYLLTASAKIYSTPHIIHGNSSTHFGNTTTLNLTITNSTYLTFILEPFVRCGSITNHTTLVRDINPAGTCFIMNQSNIILDCAGFKVTGNNNDYGVNASAENITVKNCVFVNFSTGIFLDGNTHNSTIINNVINISSGTGISFVASNRNTIFNNTITTLSNDDPGMHLVSSSDDNNISQNTVITKGSSGYAIYVHGFGDRNKIISNNIKTTGTNGFGVYVLSNSHTNEISNNKINTSSNGAYGIKIATNSHDSTVYNNDINIFGYSVAGIFLEDTPQRTNISNNRITTQGSSAEGILLQAATRNTLIANNNITTSGQSSYGVHFNTGSVLNNITNSVIVTKNITAYGIYFDTSPNNIVFNSNITSTNSAAIFIFNSSNTLYNVTFNRSSVSFINSSDNGSLLVYYYIDVNVKNSSGAYINASNLSIFNISNSLVLSQLTDVNGTIGSGTIASQTLQEYAKNATTTTYSSPYTINASKNGFVYYGYDLWYYNLNLSVFGGGSVSLRLLRDYEIINITNLTSPANGTASTSSTYNFNFTAIDNTNSTNCTLYGNFDGSFAATSSTAANVQNNTETKISKSGITAGTYLWNIRCENAPGSYSSFNRNYTLTKVALCGADGCETGEDCSSCGIDCCPGSSRGGGPGSSAQAAKAEAPKAEVPVAVEAPVAEQPVQVAQEAPKAAVTEQPTIIENPEIDDAIVPGSGGEVKLRLGESASKIIEIAGNEHKLTVDKINYLSPVALNSVDIVLQSRYLRLTLFVGETKHVDFEDDKNDDMSITLEQIIDNTLNQQLNQQYGKGALGKYAILKIIDLHTGQTLVNKLFNIFGEDISVPIKDAIACINVTKSQADSTQGSGKQAKKDKLKLKPAALDQQAKLPRDLKIAVQPFSLNCRNNSLTVTLNVPNTLVDLKALRCIKDSCTEIILNRTKQLQCEDKLKQEFREDEKVEERKEKADREEKVRASATEESKVTSTRETITSETSLASKIKNKVRLIASDKTIIQNRTITSGKAVTPNISKEGYKEAAATKDISAKIILSQDEIIQPKNPSMKMLSLPITVEFNVPINYEAKDHGIMGNNLKNLDLEILMPYITDPQVDKNSIKINIRNPWLDTWEIVDGEVNSSARTITAVVRNISQYLVKKEIKKVMASNLSDETQANYTIYSAEFTLIGAICNNCEFAAFENIYYPPTVSKATLILVHGLGSTPATFNAMINDIRLTKQPWQVWTFGYPSSKPTLDNGIDLANYIEQHVKEFEDIYIVAHSLGGILTQKTLNYAYGQNKANNSLYTFINKTKKAILVGVPNNRIAGSDTFKQLFKYIVNLRTDASLFDPDSIGVQELAYGQNIPRVPHVDYSVVAGTKPYIIETALFTVRSDDLFGLNETNDGIVTITSAQRVGGELINDRCTNYWEIAETHTEIIKNPSARSIIEGIISREISKDISIKDLGKKAVLGKNKYIELTIKDCKEEDKYVVLGKKIAEEKVEDDTGCSCGNGYCGEGEDKISCPSDCANVLRKETLCSPMFFGAIIVILILAMVSVYLGIHLKHRYGLERLGNNIRRVSLILITLSIPLTLLNLIICGKTIFKIIIFVLLSIVYLILFFIGHKVHHLIHGSSLVPKGLTNIAKVNLRNIKQTGIVKEAKKTERLGMKIMLRMNLIPKARNLIYAATEHLRKALLFTKINVFTILHRLSAKLRYLNRRILGFLGLYKTPKEIERMQLEEKQKEEQEQQNRLIAIRGKRIAALRHAREVKLQLIAEEKQKEQLEAQRNADESERKRQEKKAKAMLELQQLKSVLDKKYQEQQRKEEEIQKRKEEKLLQEEERQREKQRQEEERLREEEERRRQEQEKQKRLEDIHEKRLIALQHAREVRLQLIAEEKQREQLEVQRKIEELEKRRLEKQQRNEVERQREEQEKQRRAKELLRRKDEREKEKQRLEGEKQKAEQEQQNRLIAIRGKRLIALQHAREVKAQMIAQEREKEQLEAQRNADESERKRQEKQKKEELERQQLEEETQRKEQEKKAKAMLELQQLRSMIDKKLQQQQKIIELRQLTKCLRKQLASSEDPYQEFAANKKDTKAIKTLSKKVFDSLANLRIGNIDKAKALFKSAKDKSKKLSEKNKKIEKVIRILDGRIK